MTATGDPERPERREDERYPVFGALDGEVMVFLPMAITEIARGGVQVETPFAFQIDSIHELRLALGSRPVVVKGRVTHCSIIDVDRSRFAIVPASNSSICLRAWLTRLERLWTE